MIITLKRYRFTKWGVCGTLHIAGQKVADTAEHPTAYLPPGTYPITLDRILFTRKNGPMKNLNGEICVGLYQCSGLVIKTADYYTPLYNRIQKSLKRGHEVTLIIE